MFSKNKFLNHIAYEREFGEASSLTTFRCLSAAFVGVLKSKCYADKQREPKTAITQYYC